MPIRGSRLPQETWIAGRRIPRAGECPDHQSPQVAIEAIDPAQAPGLIDENPIKPASEITSQPAAGR
jgi:hypothetical protein